MSESSGSATPTPGSVNVVLAWVATLWASTIPAIIAGLLGYPESSDRFWPMAPVSVQIAGLLALVIATRLWPAARVMFWPLLMLLVFLIGWRVVSPLILRSGYWSDWQARQSIGMSLTTSRLQWVPPILLMAAVLWCAGFTRRQLFLTIGDWSARVQREPLFPFNGWRWFPTMFVAFLLVGWASVVPTWGASLNPDLADAGRLLAHWPGILTGAALNATAEEFVFRVALLPCFIQAVGTRQAVALSGVLFGLEHWETSGIGVILACYGGWFFARSMTETGGCSWALVQHILGDIPIYALVALARI